MSAIDIARQWRVGAARDALAEQSARLIRRGDVSPTLPTRPIAGPPEARVLDALRVARVAGALPAGAERRRLVGEAYGAASAAALARPDWGEAQVVIAYAASLGRAPGDGEKARRALARSYADAPLLHDAGQWRIRFGVQAWPALGPATRDAVLREGIWLLGVDQSRWPLVFDTFRGSPAYVPFMLRWREILSGPSCANACGLTEAQGDQRQE